MSQTTLVSTIYAKPSKNCRASVSDAMAFRRNALHSARSSSIASDASFGIIIDEAIRYAVGVFSEDAFAFNAVDVARSFVIAGLNTSKDIFAVHDIRFAIHNWATIKTCGQ